MNFNFLAVRQMHFKIIDGIIENNAKGPFTKPIDYFYFLKQNIEISGQ